MAKVSTHVKNKSKSHLHPTCYLKARHYLANAKTAEMNIPQNSYHCSISSIVIDRLGGTLSDLLELPALLWRGSKHGGEVHLHEPLINRSKQKISNPLA